MALKQRPDKVQVYFHLVRCMKEINQTSSNEWKKLLEKMKKSLNKSKKRNANDEEFDENAFTYMAASPETGIYWAIFEVAEQLGEYDTAWKYLKIGQNIERDKHFPYNKQQVNDRTQTIKEVFRDGML